ncbi:MAG: efflux RND transporter permease subunit, partial [Clostridia bacterium]|nr:efflux RND transporter permease subunit [Clostridia bacterium]
MLARFSVKKPFTVLVAVILVIILGVMAFTRMTPDLLPNIDLPYVIIATSFVGASPEEVEDSVTKPIEQSVATLDDIKTIQSSSSENYSIVMLQFSDDVNMDATTMNIREKLDLLSEGWNDYVGTPVILKISPNIIPLSAVALHYEGMDTLALSRFFEDTLSTQLEGIEGVASVTASGLIAEQVNVVLQQDKMDAVNARIRAAIDGEFAESETELADAQAELDEGYEAVEDGQRKIDSGRSSLGSAQRELSDNVTEARAQLDAQETALNDQLAALNRAAATAATLSQSIASLTDAISAYPDPEPDPPPSPSKAELEAQLSQAQAELGGLYASVASSTGMSVNSEASLSTAITAASQLINDGLDAIVTARSQIDEQEATGQGQINSARRQLNSGQTEIDNSREQLSEAQKELDEAGEALGEAKQNAYDASDLHNLLTLSSVGTILGAQNFSMPAGYAVDGSEAEWLVYVGDELASVQELEALVLFDLGLDGLEPIRLSEVADIFVSDNSASTYARLNGENAVLLTFNKQSGYSTATVSDNIHDAFDELEAGYEGLRFSPLMEQGDYIDIVISSVLENIWVGAVLAEAHVFHYRGSLAVLILLLFLRDIRPTLVVACSIPISLTFAVVLMYFSGVTLNIISLAGLAVGVGMLVDNSIVVIENVYRLRRLGVPRYQAAISGTAQMAGAITASTLTTVCVFLPIVFVEGMTRQLFGDMALTIAYSLLASLIVAITLVPALSGALLGSMRRPKRAPKHRLLNAYDKALRFSLRHKALALLLALLLLVISGYATITRGFIYLPDMDSPQMMVELTMPEDAGYDETVAVTEEVANRIRTLPEVETVGAMFSSGLANVIGLSSAAGDNTNETLIYLVLKEQASFLGYVPPAERQRSSIELSGVIESMCADLPCELSASGAGNMAEYMSVLGSSGIELKLYGDDLDALMEGAEAVGAALETVEGVENVNNGVEDTTPALHISVDKEKAIREGLTVAQVYQDIALALTEDATVTAIEDTRNNIVIRMQDAQPSLDDVKNRVLTVQNQDGSYRRVSLGDIARFSESETLRSISRDAHRRYVTVSASLAEGHNVTLVNARAERALAGIALPEGVELVFSGENESIMSALADLLMMLLLGVAIVYLIMVAQFQSLLSPLIVMFTIPLAFTGGLIALLLCGMEISIVAMIGFIMLVGIIVNNGIVLIDTMNRLRQEGMERREAVIEAARMRLRPVLMTALTTVLGLVPL